MNATVIEVRVGRDGKRYPVGWTLPEPERWRVINLSHILVHGQRMSIREAQRALLNQHGVRRSIGSIHRDLNAYTCDGCGPVVTDG